MKKIQHRYHNFMSHCLFCNKVRSAYEHSPTDAPSHFKTIKNIMVEPHISNHFSFQSKIGGFSLVIERALDMKLLIFNIFLKVARINSIFTRHVLRLLSVVLNILSLADSYFLTVRGWCCLLLLLLLLLNFIMNENKHKRNQGTHLVKQEIDILWFVIDLIFDSNDE